MIPTSRFQRVRQIEAAHIDDLGHVNNVVWLEFMIALAGAHSEAVGLDLESCRRVGGVWVVRRHSIDYHRSAVLGDTLNEETWLSEVRGARSVRHYAFRHPNDTRPLVEASSEWVWVHPETLRPRRVPPTVLTAFGAEKPASRMVSSATAPPEPSKA